MNEADYAEYYQRTQGKPPPTSPRAVKRHKFNAKRVVVDGHTFPSQLEADWHTTLLLWWKSGAISEPLLQVGFALGVQYNRESFYVADFVFSDLVTGALVVADAKGFQTRLYKQKKRTFEALYNLRIQELFDIPKGRKSWPKRKNMSKVK